jgi:hypothetical protein
MYKKTLKELGIKIAFGRAIRPCVPYLSKVRILPYLAKYAFLGSVVDPDFARMDPH